MEYLFDLRRKIIPIFNKIRVRVMRYKIVDTSENYMAKRTLSFRSGDMKKKNKHIQQVLTIIPNLVYHLCRLFLLDQHVNNISNVVMKSF